MLKNTLVENNVVIQDGCKIGQKGFGFIPLKNKNIKLEKNYLFIKIFK